MAGQLRLLVLVGHVQQVVIFDFITDVPDKGVGHYIVQKVHMCVFPLQGHGDLQTLVDILHVWGMANSHQRVALYGGFLGYLRDNLT